MEGWVDLGYSAMHWPGIEPGISRSQVQRSNHYTNRATRELVRRLLVTVLEKASLPTLKTKIAVNNLYDIWHVERWVCAFVAIVLCLVASPAHLSRSHFLQFVHYLVCMRCRACGRFSISQGSVAKRSKWNAKCNAIFNVHLSVNLFLSVPMKKTTWHRPKFDEIATKTRRIVSGLLLTRGCFH